MDIRTMIQKPTTFRCPPPPYSSKGFRHFQLGFTLAEMLIILAIIGIIAALTVPTLMKKYENHRNVTVLKKAYAELAHNYKMFTIENPEIFATINKNDNITIRDEFASYLITQKGYKDQLEGITANVLPYMKNIDNKTAYGQWFTSVEKAKTTTNGVVLKPKSGAYYLALHIGTMGRLGFIIFTDPSKSTLRIYNATPKDGLRGPTWGRNIFVFTPQSDKTIIPGSMTNNGSFAGGDLAFYRFNMTTDCNPGLNNNYPNGSGCAQRILQDGWQMKY